MLTPYAKFWMDNKEYCGKSNPSEICHGTMRSSTQYYLPYAQMPTFIED